MFEYRLIYYLTFRKLRDYNNLIFNINDFSPVSLFNFPYKVFINIAILIIDNNVRSNYFK